MINFNSVDELLDEAIRREEEAAQFYLDLAGQLNKPHIAKAVEEFAQEEKIHKAKLEAIKKSGKVSYLGGEVEDIKVSDTVASVKVGPEMDYPQVLIVAMKREKAAYKLYSDMASKISDGEVKELFLTLAEEEAKHKLRFECEYDEYVSYEN